MTILRESGSATADASGRAVVRVGPQTAFERWHVTAIQVQSTSDPLVPKCSIYRGAESRSRLIEGTYDGTFDHSDTNLWLETGEQLVAVWEEGNAAHNATLTIEGEKVRR